MSQNMNRIISYKDWLCENNLNFNHKGSILDRLELGQKEYLKIRDKEIDWDIDLSNWFMSFKLELVDIIKYKDYFIKICELLNDNDKVQGFCSTTNCGQDKSLHVKIEKGLARVPTFFKNIENATNSQKELIDGVNENLNFHKKKDPLNSLDVGSNYINKIIKVLFVDFPQDKETEIEAKKLGTFDEDIIKESIEYAKEKYNASNKISFICINCFDKNDDIVYSSYYPF